MKALIRNEGETITEDMPILGINWENGLPLTSPYWCGGSYKLIENYIPPIEPTETNLQTLTNEELEKQKKIEALEKELNELKK